MKTTGTLRLFGFSALVLALALVPVSLTHAQLVPVGGTARDFTITDAATGRPIKLSDYAGKVVVLDFFAYWCGPCQTSSPDVEVNLQKYYQARGGNARGVPVQVLAVNIDQSNPAATDAFIRNAGIGLAGNDASGAAWAQFNTGFIPTFVIINGVAGGTTPQWQVMYVRSGYEGAPALRRVIDTLGPPQALAAPAFLVQPVDQQVMVGQPLNLSAGISGFPAPTYQWLKDNVPIAGATGQTLTIAAAQPADTGRYTLVITNSAGSATSTPAVLSVLAAIVSPRAKEIGAGRVKYQLLVTSPQAWSVTSDAHWLTVTPGAGLQDQNVEVLAEPNRSGVDRVATLTIGGFMHTVRQRAESAPIRQLWGMGADNYGQLGAGRLLRRRYWNRVATNVRTASATPTTTHFIRTDGTLWSVGFNGAGQLGDGTTTQRSTPVQVDTSVREVSASANHAMYLKTDGTLWGLGSGSSGELGTGSTGSRYSPVQIATGVQAVCAGYGFTLFLKTDGTLWGMGSNAYGQLGDGSTTQRTTPVQIAAGVQTMAAGMYHSLFVKTDRTLWATGYNVQGALGDGTNTNRSTPVQVATDVQRVAAGSYHTIFLKTDTSVWSMGINSSGELGDGTTSFRRSPVQITTGAQSVSAGGHFSFILKADNTLWATGDNSDSQFGDGSSLNRVVPTQIAIGVRFATAGDAHSCWIDQESQLWAAGADVHGQLGLGTPTNVVEPLQLASGVQSVAAGESHSLLVMDDATLWAAGRAGSGQLGTGALLDTSTPLRVANGVAAAAGGDLHSVMIKTDGSLWSCGSNYYGQLGDGTTYTRTTPVAIMGSVRAAAAGRFHDLLLKTDGTLWTCGNNSYGQLGDDSTTSRSVPVRVASDVVAIAAGAYHSAFLRTDGTLWTMGQNSNYQLGDRTNVSRSAPVQIATDVRSIATGDYHTLWVRSDGTLWGVGQNSNGQLGLGSTTTRTVPVQITTGVHFVAAGSYHSLFMKADGTLWGMGSNTYGQLGSLPLNNRTMPAQIAAQVASFAAGGNVTFFITATGVPEIMLQPMAQGTDFGGTVTFSVQTAATGVMYQWRKDGVPLPGATAASLTISNAQAGQAGVYDVVVTNAAGTVTSSPAALAVGISRIANLSVRTNLAAGQPLIVGFATTGAKPILVRGIGPGLHALLPQYFSANDVYADPLLELYSPAGACIDQNDNWAGALQPTFTSVGAFPLNGGSRDAALHCSLAGAHSVHLKGTGSGVALVEVYDAGQGYSPRLSNLSARNFVGTGADILIAGFNIDGPVAKQLLIRGVGPGLHAAFPQYFAAAEVLADPKLEIYNAAGVKVEENDNWSASHAAVFRRLGAFDLPAGSKDAALLVMLPPGTYSAQLSGVGASTGTGLVEVYELP